MLVWFADRVLLIRNSYQPRWSAPGGSVEDSESAFDAATRELGEEVGIQIRSAELIFVRDVTFDFRYRKDKVSLFEWHPAKMPSIMMDEREIIKYQWFLLDETTKVNLLPHLEDYFDRLRQSPIIGRI